MLLYWSVQSVAGDVDWEVVATAAGNSLLLAGLAALVTTLVALPVAWLGARFPGRWSAAVDTADDDRLRPARASSWPSRSSSSASARCPRSTSRSRCSSLAMVVLFLPLAVGSARAALLQVPPRLEEAARVSGRSPLAAAWSVTIPLARSGVLAGAALVFLATIKELPAVVLLSPIGFETLPLVIWQETTRSFFESGAVPALVLLAVSAPPLWLLVGRTR